MKEIPARLLSPSQKRRVWGHVRQHCPEVEAFLVDPEVRQLMGASAMCLSPLFAMDLLANCLEQWELDNLVWARRNELREMREFQLA